MRKNWINLLARDYDQVDTKAQESAIASVGYSATKSAANMDTLDKKVQTFNNTIKELYIGVGDSGLMTQLKGIVEFGTVLAKVGAWAAPLLLTLGEVAIALKLISGTMKVIKGQSMTQWLDTKNLSWISNISGFKGASFNAGTTSAAAYGAAVKSLQADVLAGNITHAQSASILSGVSKTMGGAALSADTLAAARGALKVQVVGSMAVEAAYRAELAGQGLTQDAINAKVAARTVTEQSLKAQLAAKTITEAEYDVLMKNRIVTQAVMDAEMKALIVTTNASTVADREKTAATAALDKMNKMTAASTKGLQLAMMGMTLGITAVIMAVVSGVMWLTQMDERQKKLLEDGASVAKQYEDESKTIKDLTEQYAELSESGKTDTETKKQLLDIQGQLVKSYGVESDGLDLVNGKYQEQIEKLQELEKEKAKEYIRENQKAANDAEDILNKKQPFIVRSNTKDRVGAIAGEMDGVETRDTGFSTTKFYINGDLEKRVSTLKDIIDAGTKLTNQTEAETETLGKLSDEYKRLKKEMDDANEIVKKMATANLTDGYSEKLGEMRVASADLKKAMEGTDSAAIEKANVSYDNLYASMKEIVSGTNVEDAFKTWAEGLNTVSTKAKDTEVQIGLTKEQIAALTKTFDSSMDSISGYNKLMEDYKTNGKFSAESVKEIIDKHQELAGYLNNEPLLYQKMSEALNAEKDTANKAYREMMTNSDSYYKSNIEGTDKIKDALGDYYKDLTEKQKDDLKNTKNLASAKLIVERELLSRLNKAWGDYLAAQTIWVSNISGIAGAASVSTPESEAMTKALIEYSKYRDQINAINTSFDSITANITAPGIDSYGASTTKATTATKALTDATKQATDAVKDYDNAMKSLDNQIKEQDNSMSKLGEHSEAYRNGLREKAKLIQKEIDLTKQAILVNEANARSLAALANASSKSTRTTTPTTASSSSSSSRTYTGKYADWINAAAKKNGLDARLIAGMIQTESGFNPNAVNKSSGATGLGQFLASTAKDEGLKDRTDPKSSIDALAAYLKKRIGWAGGNVNKGIMGYGEGTTAYLNKVLANASSFGYGGGLTTSAGSSSTHSIKEIQKVVGVAVDGIMGTQTRNAIKAWQKAHGLTADGIVGTNTSNAMFGTSSTIQSTTGDQTDNTAADNITSKVESEKSTLSDKEQQLLEIPYLIFKDTLGEFDDRTTEASKNISILRNELELTSDPKKQTVLRSQITTGLKEQLQIAKEKEAYINQEIASRKYSVGQVADMNKELLTVKETQSSISVEIKKQADDQLKIVEDTQDKVTQIIKKQVDERKKLINDEYNAKKEALSKEKNLYNDKNTTDDYNKNLTKEQNKLNDINASITSASRDKSLSGQARLKDLQDQKKAQQEVIDNMILDRTRETNNKLFDEQDKLLDKQNETDNKTLDEKYSDENIKIMAQAAIISGVFKNLDGTISTTSDAFAKFEDQTGTGIKAISDIVKNDFISSLQQAKTVLENMGGVSITTAVSTDAASLQQIKDLLTSMSKVGVTAMVGAKRSSVPSYAVGTTYLATDQLAQVHKGEAIIPRDLNPFNGGLPLLKFANMLFPNIPSSSSSGKSAPIINFNVPLVNIQGDVSKDALPGLREIITMAKTEFTNEMISKLNDLGIY